MSSQGENPNGLRWRVEANTERLTDHERRLRTMEQEKGALSRVEERFANLQRDFSRLEVQVRTDIQGVKADVKDEFGGFRKLMIAMGGSVLAGAIIFALTTSLSGGP